MLRRQHGGSRTDSVHHSLLYAIAQRVYDISADDSVCCQVPLQSCEKLKAFELGFCSIGCQVRDTDLHIDTRAWEG